MSHQLARRTGTVGALVAAASMTMVAGVWPAVGMASAADAPPGQVKQDGAIGAETAPGQVKKDAEPVVGPVAGPVAEPVVEPVVEAPQADAPGQVKKEVGAPAPQDAAPGQVAKAAPAEQPTTTAQEPTTTVQQPVTTAEPAPAQEPVVGPVAGAEKKNKRPGKEEKITKQAGPPTGTDPAEKAAPAAAGPGKAPGKAEAPATHAPGREPVEPPREETRVPVGPATGLAPAPKKAPRVGPAAPKAAPEAAAPAAEQSRPAAPAKVGPAVPVAPVAPVRTSTPAASATTATASAPADRRTLPVGPAVVRQPSRQALAAAADPLPLRPVGSDAIVLPQPVRAEVAAVDLAHALPGLAAGTVGAVARTPELPLGIAAVVVLFLLVQGRIDRRDPKLAEAPIEDDQPLEFVPALQVHLRLVAAA